MTCKHKKASYGPFFLADLCSHCPLLSPTCTWLWLLVNSELVIRLVWRPYDMVIHWLFAVEFSKVFRNHLCQGSLHFILTGQMLFYPILVKPESYSSLFPSSSSVHVQKMLMGEAWGVSQSPPAPVMACSAVCPPGAGGKHWAGRIHGCPWCSEIVFQNWISTCLPANVLRVKNLKKKEREKMQYNMSAIVHRADI